VQCACTHGTLSLYASSDTKPDRISFLAQDLRGALSEAVELTGQSREVFKLFWSAQQRFFKLLCISMKVCCLSTIFMASADP
jgi:hypothetical protein